MIYIFSNNIRHPVANIFTTLHYTSQHFTQLHFSSITLNSRLRKIVMFIQKRVASNVKTVHQFPFSITDIFSTAK
jgi:hypothetical protein